MYADSPETNWELKSGNILEEDEAFVTESTRFFVDTTVVFFLPWSSFDNSSSVVGFESLVTARLGYSVGFMEVTSFSFVLVVVDTNVFGVIV